MGLEPSVSEQRVGSSVHSVPAAEWIQIHQSHMQPFLS